VREKIRFLAMFPTHFFSSFKQSSECIMTQRRKAIRALSAIKIETEKEEEKEEEEKIKVARMS
jgi:hypothetical protein